MNHSCDNLVNKIDKLIDKTTNKIVEIDSPNQIDLFQIPEIDHTNRNAINYYLSNHQPCIIRNGCLQSHKVAIEKWDINNPNYLISKAGDNKVFVRRNTNKDCYRNGFTYSIENVQFSEYLSRFRKDHKKHHICQSSYLAVTSIQSYLPQLMSDLPQFITMDQDKILNIFDTGNDECECERKRCDYKRNYEFKLHSGPHIWIGHSKHYEFCHFDPSHSFLSMINGIKKVLLFNPKFLNQLHCNKLGSKGRTIQSKIDFSDEKLFDYDPFYPTLCKDNDYDKCSIKIKNIQLLKKTFDNFSSNDINSNGNSNSNVYGLIGILNPGDVLFIPTFWFHQVTSLTDSISVNYFCGDYTSNYVDRIISDSNSNTNTNSTCVSQSLIYWYLNIIEQNRQTKQFSNIIGNSANIIIALKNFVFKQWHEKATKKQIEYFIKLMKDYLKKCNNNCIVNLNNSQINNNDTVTAASTLCLEAFENDKIENTKFQKHACLRIRGLLHRADTS